MNTLSRTFYNNSFARWLYNTPAGRFVYHLPATAADLLSGKRDPLVPPRWKVFTGRGNYREIGERFSALFKDCGLKPDDAVLDVGSGMGRMAVGLVDYLSPDARYHGLEIVRAGVSWCTRHITSRYPHFRFHHADIYNRMYNRKGSVMPADYRFPFENEAFDFAFLTSVFTHMLPPDVKHYLEELCRVLKRGGTCVATANLINGHSAARIEAGTTSLDMKYTGEHYRTVSLKTPEFNIGLEEDWLLEAYAAAGLVVEQPVLYGRWCRETTNTNFQDVIVARKA
ncbi:MAG: methyltransferase domain-containing protein [Chitinivibrionales bacterium]|nr:methyltransferase domain-containing protein [Chitinivibrionales bacterium]MBD3394204.1 methyltransferase domain-containing protein [Chitinivibrionales bacterium]